MKIAKDSLWLLIARVGSQGMAALATILLARRLGSERFGMYAVMAAVVLVGNMNTTFGTDMSLIREIAAADDLSSLPHALILQLLLSLLFIAGTWVATPLFLASSDAIRAMRLYSLALIPLSFFTIATSLLRGKGFMGAYAGLNLTASALKFILLWAFIDEQSTMIFLAFLLFSIQCIVTLIAGFICGWKIHGFWRNWNFQLRGVSELFKDNFPLGVLTGLALLQQKLPTLILSGMGGSAATGIFSAAARTVEAAETGHSAVFTAIYPVMARETEKRRLQLPFMFLILGALSGAVILSVWAMPITEILFGRGYEASASALRILAWMMIPYTVNTFLILQFVAMKRETPVVHAAMVSLAVLVLTSLWWIPREGVIGAGCSALLAEVLQALLLILSWRRTWVFPIIPISKI